MKRNAHIVDIIFILSLFCIFTAGALLVVLMGADVYQGITKDMDHNYSSRSSISYVTEKIRQHDSEGQIFVGDLENEPALILTQNYNNDTYETWIYRDGNHLKEIMVAAGTQVNPGDGQELMEVTDFQLEAADQSIRIAAADGEGKWSESMVYVQCGPVKMREG